MKLQSIVDAFQEASKCKVKVLSDESVTLATIGGISPPTRSDPHRTVFCAHSLRGQRSFSLTAGLDATRQARGEAAAKHMQ